MFRRRLPDRTIRWQNRHRRRGAKRAEEWSPSSGPELPRPREGGPRVLDIGYPAKDAVLAGQKSADAEISRPLQQALPAHLAGRTGEAGPEVPRRPGRSGPRRPARRRPLAQDRRRWQGEPAALRRHGQSPSRAATGRGVAPRAAQAGYSDHSGPFTAGCTDRPDSARAERRATSTESEVLLFLFLGAAGDVRPPSAAGISSSYYLPVPQLHLALPPSSRPTRRPSRSASCSPAGWRRSGTRCALRRGIDVAAQNKVHECAPVVLKIAADPGTATSSGPPRILGFGEARHQGRHQGPGPVPEGRAPSGGDQSSTAERATVQMRDVALGAAVQLAGQNLADFGFERQAPAGLAIVSYIYYAFETDEKRAAAHAEVEGVGGGESEEVGSLATRRPARRSSVVVTPNAYTVVCVYVLPGSRTTLGNSFWLIESGKCWVSRQKPAVLLVLRPRPCPSACRPGSCRCRTARPARSSCTSITRPRLRVGHRGRRPQRARGLPLST